MVLCHARYAVYVISNVSDTALWAAAYRADESDRPDALFRDPYARRLAGDRGIEILRGFPRRARQSWSWVSRTVLFDEFITHEVRDGADVVLNLAAGLDARPYRLPLPSALRWIEVDLPALLDYKTAVLADVQPGCALERVPLDVLDLDGRRRLLQRIKAEARRVLVLTEGLLIYLSDEQVGGLADDLGAPPFSRWILDLVSPGLLKMLTRQIGSPLARAGAPLRFAPPDGPMFFARHGWMPIDVRSLLKTGARLGRLSLGLRLAALLPERPQPGHRPWGGVGLFGRG